MTKARYIVEAIVFDYDTGAMCYQPITRPTPNIQLANRDRFLFRCDFPSARVRKVLN